MLKHTDFLLRFYLHKYKFLKEGYQKMKFVKILLMVVTISNLSYSEVTKYVGKDSMQTDSFRKVFLNIDSLKEHDKNISNDFKALKEEFVKYEISEKYFSNILSSQTTLFSIIITGLLALASVITLFQFNSIIKKTEEKFKKDIINLEDKWKKHDDLIRDASFNSYKACSNSYISAKELCHQNKEYAYSFIYFLKAGIMNLLTSEYAPTREKVIFWEDKSQKNLKKAITYYNDNLENNANQVDILKNNKGELSELLEILCRKDPAFCTIHTNILDIIKKL